MAREAQILFHLEHPRILWIEAACSHAPIPYLVTELASGSLADQLAAAG